jgi:putative DNA primase/helicase
LANLKDKLINISSEIGSKDLETEMLKKLSGNDLIYADRKYKDGLSFVNIARLLINANELPRFSELNDAILERFVLIKFPRTFRDEEVNTNLLSELLSDLPGIFNLVISRFNKIQSGVGGGGIYYPIPESIRKDRDILLSEISSAAEFIDGDCVKHPEVKIKFSKLFNEYERFCVINGYKALGSKNFKKAIYSAFNFEFKREDDGWWIEGLTTKKVMNSISK